jgi:threonine dehydrogenase-like Zn-dependent dehydrogenase
LSGRLPAIGTGPLGFVTLDDVPRRELPGDDWVRLQPRLTGVCGSDLGVITAHDSFTLEPFGAYPFTFGHEVIGTVAEVGPAVTGWSEGDRVIVNPMLACEQKGVGPCPACRRGDVGVCRRVIDGTGSIAGFSPLTGGGWADEMVVHQSMLIEQGEIPDEVAVLTDAYASAAKGVFLEPPEPGDVVLVRALRRLGWDGTIAVSARYGFQAEKARELGADVVLRGSDTVYEWAESLPGASLRKPSMAPNFVEGGPSLVYDSVGSAGTVRDALSLTREQGRIVVTGAAASSKVDLTRLWHRQLRMTGVMVYGPVEHQGRTRDIFDATLDLIRGDDLGRFNLLTHTFELEEYRDAIRVALGKDAHEAIKVGFRVR